MKYNDYVVLVQNLFSSDNGERVLKELIKENVFNPISPLDDRQAAYLLGKRDLVLELLAIVKPVKNEEIDYLGDF